ncbi:hypothetical protein CKAH01_04922 [Colletotrichum kahawae]|uniref:Uncharacterized protein n=1 Tax=Colletotrichum kahawae TaxID=34407 RepID=A0AAD9YIE2_COLKA|nr:hypothetical protein CKAH01_04922 [Colletotrichum kahawae]
MERTYFILRNTNYKPDRFIQLGQLIAEPQLPYRPIAPPLRPLPPDLLQQSYNTDWSLGKSSVSTGEVGANANFLTAIAAEASINATQDSGSSWEAAKLETTTLELGEDDDSQQYVKDSIEGAAVRKWLEGKFFKKVLYIVTGLKIARKPGHTSSEVSGGRGGGLKFAADPGTGGLTSLGAHGNLNRTEGIKETSTPSDDFVFAYRLRKVHISLFNKVALGKDVRGADLYRDGYANNDSSSEIEEDVNNADKEVPVEVDDIDEVLIEDEDFGPSLPGSVEKRSAIDDDDGVECLMVLVG